mmetsp:Transcript_14664/g.39258  ORF Transcript_14664/g.39258 Transcript_14664/m.39258 type:complete len:231 (-) Transcript_14664:638-1330(-)
MLCCTIMYFLFPNELCCVKIGVSASLSCASMLIRTMARTRRGARRLAAAEHEHTNSGAGNSARQTLARGYCQKFLRGFSLRPRTLCARVYASAFKICLTMSTEPQHSVVVACRSSLELKLRIRLPSSLTADPPACSTKKASGAASQSKCASFHSRTPPFCRKSAKLPSNELVLIVFQLFLIASSFTATAILASHVRKRRSPYTQVGTGSSMRGPDACKKYCTATGCSVNA